MERLAIMSLLEHTYKQREISPIISMFLLKNEKETFLIRSIISFVK